MKRSVFIAIFFSIAVLGTIVAILLNVFDEQYYRDKELKRVKKKYSADGINYYYESAFCFDSGKVLDFALKRKNDALVFLEGEMWPEDSIYVKDVLDRLNSLKLPVRLDITTERDKANMIIYFGNRAFLDEKMDYPVENSIGMIPFSYNVPYIDSIKIGIVNDSQEWFYSDPKTRGRRRTHVILEEVAQSMGLVGDSWRNYHSLFFEGPRESGFYDTDKDLLRFCYEPVIPYRYAKEQFEADFSDVLYHMNTADKIVKYVKEHDIPVRYLDSIRNLCFYDTTLIKFSEYNFVRFEGDYTQSDVDFWKKAFTALNSVSDRLQFDLTQYSDSLHITPAIYLRYDRKKEPGLSRIRVMKKKIMFPRFIDVFFDIPNDERNTQQANRLLLNDICRILGPKVSNAIDVDSSGTPCLNPDYKEILALMYEPVFYSGMPRYELDKAIEILQNEK